jgi:SAM-dependent methyltransferase
MTPKAKAGQAMTTNNSNFGAARQFVEFGLEEKKAGRRESASGPGSSRAAAQPTLKLLRRFLRNSDVTSILDLGCGDWNWMRHLNLPTASTERTLSYTGWDASAELIESLQQDFGSEQIDFAVADFNTQDLPQTDLIVIRDVLFHLPLSQSVPLVKKISQSCRYMLSTSFLGMPENNDIDPYLPIDGWGFHRINLNVAPFDLAEMMSEAVKEPLGANKGRSRYICLYEFDAPAGEGMT